MTIAQALIHSIISSPLKSSRELTPRSVIETAHRMGLNAQLDDDLTLTLGSSGVTLMDIASAIGVLDNRGILLEPYAIEKIVTSDGTLAYEHYPMTTQVLDRETVDTMLAMMQGVVQNGTARAAAIGRPVAGKQAPATITAIAGLSALRRKSSPGCGWATTITPRCPA